MKIEGQSSDMGINHKEKNMRQNDKIKNIPWVKAAITSIEVHRNW